MQKIFLIDLANLFFRAFFAVPQSMQNNAVFGVCGAIFSILEIQKPAAIFAFRDRRAKTFRHKIDENYKAQRPKTPENLVAQLPKIFEFFEKFNLPLFAENGFEADDLIASFARKFKNKNHEILIVSTDRDLFSLIDENVKIFLPRGGGVFEKIDAEKCVEKMGVAPSQISDFKALSGDASDNLKGIAGIGAKTAARLLNEFENLENLEKNLDKISQKKVRENLEKNFNDAKKCRELTKLNFDFQFNEKIFDCENCKKFDFLAATEFFKNLNFHSLRRRCEKFLPTKNFDKKNQLSFF